MCTYIVRFKDLSIMDVNGRGNIWFAVVNVYAASKKASAKWSEASKILKAKNIDFHSCRTGGSGNAEQITFDACSAGYRKFIAVGGDGTVHDVLNGIATFVRWSEGKLSLADFTIGVIPVGSGNDWIKTLGITNDISKAIDVIADGCVSRQDVVKVGIVDPADADVNVFDSYMANIGGVGIDARVCERVNAKKREGKRGKILYVTSLIHAISRRKPAGARVECDGVTVFDGNYLSMAFGVGKYSGGGMRQTPDAVLDDGLLDVTIIPDLPLGRIAREVPRLFTGTFLEVPELVVAKARTVVVWPHEGSSAEPVEVDGEVVGRAPVRFDVLDDQINVLVPKS